ncbi:MAG TPA: DNA primase [Gemmatimonadaceae bacterium]|nr:DNA primase [Gemmatimonadaceae bacterium]
MIPDEEIDRVLDAADILTVIGERVRLKRVGNSWRGPCPFHQGKGDNFSVMPGRGYRCWVCGETGSVFTFVQKQLGLDFVEAVKYVGQKAGIEVREVTRRTQGPDPREPLWELVAAAAEYFRATLWDESDAAAAREYLASRTITREVADRFLLGYAPRNSQALRGHLEKLGYTTERQIQAGVLKEIEGRDPVPRFRGRLMFPIHDVRGRAVGFGGRSIDGGEPKYINSAESAIYSKGTLLYHLHEARFAIRKTERVLLVEGYFDALRTAAAGIEEVVAPLGTALTREQAQLIKRYSGNVFLLYDSDQAGLKATFRAGDLLLQEGAAVRVVTLPDGEDPDTFVAKFGAAGLEKELRAAVDVFERKIQLLNRHGWFADLAKSRKAIDRLLPTIRAAADPVTRDLYIARAAQASGVDRETLVREAAAGPVDPQQAMTAATSGSDARRRPGDARVGPGFQAERALISVMLASPDRIESITEAIAQVDDEAHTDSDAAEPAIRDGRLRAIHRAILASPDDVSVLRLSDSLKPDAVALLEELVASQLSIVHPDATVEDAVNVLKARWRKERIAMLRNSEMDQDRIQAETLRYKKEIQELARRPSSGASH